jgi:hypothetical protein
VSVCLCVFVCVCVCVCVVSVSLCVRAKDWLSQTQTTSIMQHPSHPAL